MIVDAYAGRHSTGSPAAVAAFEQAIASVARHQPGAAEALDAALAADPDLIAAHALRGFAAVILARSECVPAADDAYALAAAALARRPDVTSDESVLVHALDAARRGRLRAAADRLDAHLHAEPGAFLPLKLSHSLRFMAGDLGGMLALTSRVLPAWTEDRPGAGFVLGCHAFGLEEAGELAPAERYGLRAVELEPGDAWGLHAVSHVHETQGRTREGASWLEASRPRWAACNNFRFHLSWHLALFELEEGHVGRVLDLYDDEVRPTRTDDFRDVANAASLLWRLSQEGVDVGDRWAELAAVSRRRTRDVTLVFASLHHILALVGAGQRGDALALAGEISARERSGGDQGRVAGQVGRDLARVILDLGDAATIARAAAALPLIGGSHAQRDVFLRTLALAAADRGERDAMAVVMGCRAALRREDRFCQLAHQRLARAEAARRRVA
ncbi:tetratricopeptide repeat protein 38 family protein [Alsobacter metallidurans]|uniref:Tetratricopeptide repeat protein 38 n=1 Tax=Alsobacter metallidurans TaxID=340221 RepID=A0A917MGL2_9HYPH|nr:tetratricopeptide repeat protein [Alsobacter metallidurans]GGH09614.1 tetratricopeptide repeat protein 38 family protein [Alsobacter metallidurans]